jgi:hypothetical protein
MSSHWNYVIVLLTLKFGRTQLAFMLPRKWQKSPMQHLSLEAEQTWRLRQPAGLELRPNHFPADIVFSIHVAAAFTN